MEGLSAIIERHRGRGAILDTNLLLLLLVGQLDPKLISSFGRTTAYTEHDFTLLVEVFQPLDRFIVTPHVLAETGNLGGKGFKGTRRQEFFALLLAFLRAAEEVRIESRAFEEIDFYIGSRLGLTDSLITVSAAKFGHLVLTDDAELAGELAGHSLDVIKFSTLRG